MKIFLIRGGLGNQLYIYSNFIESYDNAMCIEIYSQLHDKRYHQNLIAFSEKKIKSFRVFRYGALKHIFSSIFFSIVTTSFCRNFLGFFQIKICDGYYQANLDYSAAEYIYHQLFPDGISSYNDVIFIHVRLGDMLSKANSKLYYQPTLSWYISRVNEIKITEPNIKVVFSTDSIDILKRELSKLHVHWDWRIHDGDVMSVLALGCASKYFVGSSSSLSYWIYNLRIIRLKELPLLCSFLPERFYHKSELKPALLK